MRKKLITMAVTVILVSSLVTTPAFTQTYSRSITAWFNNLTLEVDGTKINLKNEPFVYNNEVYVPLRELSDHVLFNFQQDEGSKIIKLKTNRKESSATDNYQHHYEVVSLRSQIDELQKEIALLKDGPFPYQKISTTVEMEDYLKEHFRKLKDIPMTIRFRHNGGNRYTLSTVFSQNELIRWNDLSRREIENWVDDMFFVVRDLLNPNAIIEGDVRQMNSNGTQHANYWTRGEHLYYEFKLAEHKKNQIVDVAKIQTALNQNLRNYNGQTFSYEVFVNQSDVDVIATYNDNFNSWSPTLKMQYLRRIKTEVARVYDNVTVNGRVVSGTGGHNDFRFSFEGDFIRSADLLNDMERDLNLNYRNYKFRNNTFAFTYRVYEGYSGSFQVKMEGDFSGNDEQWQIVKNDFELNFRNFIQDSFRHIESLWNVDIFGTVVDKNAKTIGNVEFYKSAIYGIRFVQPIIFD